MSRAGEESQRPLVQLTFVVRLSGQTELASLSGRVEHLWSGQAIEFESAAELLTFLRRMVAATR